MSEHDPLPWRADEKWAQVVASNGALVGQIGTALNSGKSSEANLALIVRAVNAHAGLVAIVEELLEADAAGYIFGVELTERVTAALKAVKGES